MKADNPEKKPKKKMGRPTVMTPKVVAKLIEGFRNDFTDIEACHYAGIDKVTYYRHLKKDPTFATEIEAAKVFLFTSAKKNIANSVIDNSVEDSWKFLTKRQKLLYSERIENVAVEEDLNPLTLDELNERIREEEQRLNEIEAGEAKEAKDGTSK